MPLAAPVISAALPCIFIVGVSAAGGPQPCSAATAWPVLVCVVCNIKLRLLRNTWKALVCSIATDISLLRIAELAMPQIPVSAAWATQKESPTLSNQPAP